MERYHIGIIEDQEHFVEYLEERLGKDDKIKLSKFDSAESFIENGNHEIFDLIYLDINLKEMNGIDLLKHLYSFNSEHKIAILTTISSDSVIFNALEFGAIGYLLKSEVSDLLDITYIFLNGGTVITPTIAFHVLRKFKKIPISGFERLSDREKQILEELTKGYTAEEVAFHFKLSTHTVRTQIRSIYSKLNVNNRTMLMNKLNSYEGM